MNPLEDECREWLSRRMKSSAYAPFDVVVRLMTKFAAKVAEGKGDEVFILLDLESSGKNLVHGVYKTLKECQDARDTLAKTNLSDDSAIIVTEHIG